MGSSNGTRTARSCLGDWGGRDSSGWLGGQLDLGGTLASARFLDLFQVSSDLKAEKLSNRVVSERLE
jgi:hypothetical protein